MCSVPFSILAFKHPPVEVYEISGTYLTVDAAVTLWMWSKWQLLKKKKKMTTWGEENTNSHFICAPANLPLFTSCKRELNYSK